jgi:hypothetical protein
MKNKILSVATVAMILVSGAFVASCKKKADTTPVATTTPADNSSTTATENSIAENHSNDADQVGAEAIDNSALTTVGRAGSGMLSPMSGSVTITPGTGNVLVTFVNYVGMDGHLRNGSILYSYSGGVHYRDAGMTITVTTPTANPYMVDSNTVSINKNIVNSGFNSSGNMYWTITTTVTVTKPASAGSFTWMANRTKTLLNTNATTMFGNSYAAAYTNAATPISWSTALVGIGGYAHGTSSDGKTYNVTIMSDLVRDFNCSPAPVINTHFHPFIAGEIDFIPTGKTARQFNYGTGACDKTYTLTIGSYSTAVTINR